MLSICQLSPSEIFIDMFRFGRVVSAVDITQTIYSIPSGEPFRYVIKVDHEQAGPLLIGGMENSGINVYSLKPSVRSNGLQEYSSLIQNIG